MTELRTGVLLHSGKKEWERQLLEEFASVYPHFSSGVLDDFERPDFVLSTDAGRVIGVELVRYLRGQTSGQGGSVDLKDEKDHESVVNQAQAMFEAETNASLQVSLAWHPGRHLHKSNLLELSSDLAGLVKRNLPSEVHHLLEVQKSEIAETQLRRCVADIFVVKLRDGAHSKWSSFEGTWLEVGKREIQSIVDSKNHTAQEYRQHVCQEYQACSAIWLVIVAEGRYVASLVHFSDDAKNHGYQASFDRVLFWDRLRQETITLRQPS